MGTRQAGLIAMIGIVFFAAASCKDEQANSCIPNQTVVCDCANGARGVQTCTANGNSYSVCQCGPVATSCEDTVEDFNTCLDCYCEDEWNACDGNEECISLLYCLSDCQDSDCDATCAETYSDGVDDFVAVLDCRDENCTAYQCEDVYNFDTCLMCYCGDFVDTCDYNPDCIDLLYCISECDTSDATCQEACAADYPNGVNDLLNVFYCRDDYCWDYMK